MLNLYFKDYNEAKDLQRLQHYRIERDTASKIKRRKKKRKQKKKRNKKNRNQHLRKKLSKKSKNLKKQNRQGIVFEGENCQFVDFGIVGSEGSGCVDGTKMVLKNK